MLTINVSVGTQTQGLKLNGDVVTDLMGNLSDADKANVTIESIKAALALYAHARLNIPLNTAFSIVEQGSTLQT